MCQVCRAVPPVVHGALPTALQGCPPSSHGRQSGRTHHRPIRDVQDPIAGRWRFRPYESWRREPGIRASNAL